MSDSEEIPKEKPAEKVRYFNLTHLKFLIFKNFDSKRMYTN